MGLPTCQGRRIRDAYTQAKSVHVCVGFTLRCTLNQLTFAWPIFLSNRLQIIKIANCCTKQRRESSSGLDRIVRTSSSRDTTAPMASKTPTDGKQRRRTRCCRLPLLLLLLLLAQWSKVTTCFWFNLYKYIAYESISRHYVEKQFLNNNYGIYPISSKLEKGRKYYLPCLLTLPSVPCRQDQEARL